MKYADKEVDEEVVRILMEDKELQGVQLSWRKLRFVPEDFWKLRGLVVLDLSHNLLEVSVSFQ